MQINKGSLGRAISGAICLGLTLVAQAKPLPPPLPEEEIRVEKLSLPDGNRLYVSDTAFHHMVDGRLMVFDGKSFKFLGMIGTGFGALTTHSPDKKDIYVVTTYQHRLSRAPREDVLEIHDATTLELKAEVTLPPRRAQSLPYRGLLATSDDGRFLYVQNATPATSVTVVDLQQRKVVSEVQTPGCWSLYPWGGDKDDLRRVSTICGDGTLLTLALDGAGQVTGRNRSARFFDPDKDPIFTHPERLGDKRYFVSYGANVYTVRFEGDAPSFEPVWSLLDDKTKKSNWRPGGYQLTAIHHASGTFFVGMHPKGYEGSHKNPAKEIWAFDLNSHKRIARFSGNDAVALTVSQGADSRLFALDVATTSIEVRAIKTGYPVLGKIQQAGEVPMVMEVR